MNLKDFLTEKGIDASCEEKLMKLTEFSLAWNEKINVTAIREPNEFIRKNVIDSLAVCGLNELNAASSVLDLGTGGGFPGLPLAIVYPEKEFVLADSVAKKLKVVSGIASQLGLTNVSTVHARAEDLARDPACREGFDLVVSRAVASLPVLCEYCLPFVKCGGSFIAYKTENSAAEIEQSQKAITGLGGSLLCTAPDGIPGSGHIFVIIKKTTQTPKRFPRKPSEIKNNPL